jgi:hypothetical protein
MGRAGLNETQEGIFAVSHTFGPTIEGFKLLVTFYLSEGVITFWRWYSSGHAPGALVVGIV